MKNYSPLLLFILISALGYGQNYESKYAVFDRNMVLVNGTKENSERVCVVPKGKPVRIMEKVRGPIYKAQYKNWKGYIVSFNLKNRLENNPSNVKKQYIVRKSPKKEDLCHTIAQDLYNKKNQL